MKAIGNHIIIRPIDPDATKASAIILAADVRQGNREKRRMVLGEIVSIGTGVIVEGLKDRAHEHVSDDWQELAVGDKVAYTPWLSGTIPTVHEGEATHLEIILAKDVLAVLSDEDFDTMDASKRLDADASKQLGQMGTHQASGGLISPDAEERAPGAFFEVTD